MGAISNRSNQIYPNFRTQSHCLPPLAGHDLLLANARCLVTTFVAFALTSSSFTLPSYFNKSKHPWSNVRILKAFASWLDARDRFYHWGVLPYHGKVSEKGAFSPYLHEMVVNCTCGLSREASARDSSELEVSSRNGDVIRKGINSS